MTKKSFKRVDSKGHEEIWEWNEAFIKGQTIVKLAQPPARPK
jgi:hypothetical protein